MTIDLINIQIQDGNLVVGSREIAKNFEKEHRGVLRDLDNLKEGVAQNWADLFYETKYTHSQNKQEYREVLMNRDGFTLLAMGFTGAKALHWKLKYIEAFNKMKKTIRNNQLDTSQLSPQTQVLINLELGLNKLETGLSENKQEIQNMRDVITLSPASWRKDTTAFINKIALAIGGFDHIKEVREQSYQLLDERFGVDVKTRLTNKRRRMADEGVCKSRRDKITILDVIADDKKLIEGYITIVKEMAIKNKVA